MMTFQCKHCGCAFHAYPSQERPYCSRPCARRACWAREDYRAHMSAAHKGQPSSMAGKRHSRESILLLRAARFNGEGRVRKGNGYIYVYAPDHPRATNGRVPEHNLIAERALGRVLRAGEVVHHVNGTRDDNRNANLVICSDSYHKRLHAKMRRFGVDVKPLNPLRDVETGRFMPAHEVAP